MIHTLRQFAGQVLFILIVLSAMPASESMAQPGIDPISQIYHFWERPLDIELNDGYAYISTGRELLCYDISEIEAPSLMSFLSLPGVGKVHAIVDSVLWIQVNTSSFAIDISDPSEMEILSGVSGTNEEVSVTDSFFVYSGGEVYWQGQTPYTRTWFVICDVTNVRNPQPLYSTMRENGFPSLDFGTNYCISGRRLFKWNYLDDDGLYVLDFSDPTRPENLEFSGIQVHPVSVVAGGSSLVCLTPRDESISLVDIRDPVNMRVSAELPEIAGVIDISVDENRIYSVHGENGIAIADIEDSENPEILFNEPGRSHGLRISAYGSQMAIIDDSNFVDLYSVADPTEPSFRNRIDQHGSTEDLAINGNFLCLAAGFSGVRVIDYSDPSRPVETGHGLNQKRVMRVAAREDICIAANRDTTLDIFQIPDNGAPRLRSSIPANEISGGIYGLIQFDSYLYVITDIRQLLVFDCSNPDSPGRVRQIDLGSLPRFTQNLRIENEILQIYCADRVLFFDLQNPETPDLVRSFISPIASNCLIDDRFAHRIVMIPDPDAPVVTFYHFYELYDISDPDSARLLDRLLFEQIWYGDRETPTQIYQIEAVNGGNCLISKRKNSLYAYSGDLQGIDDRPVTSIELPYYIKNTYYDRDEDICYVLNNTSICTFRLNGSLTAPSAPGKYLPSTLSLAAFPNPFNSSTTISYSLPVAGVYSLSIFDIQGRLVTRLADGWREAGSYHQVLNGGQLTSGEYLVRLKGASESFARPITIVK